MSVNLQTKELSWTSTRGHRTVPLTPETGRHSTPGHRRDSSVGRCGHAAGKSLSEPLWRQRLLLEDRATDLPPPPQVPAPPNHFCHFPLPSTMPFRLFTTWRSAEMDEHGDLPWVWVSQARCVGKMPTSYSRLIRVCLIRAHIHEGESTGGNGAEGAEAGARGPAPESQEARY